MNLRQTLMDTFAARVASKTPGGQFPTASDLYSADNWGHIYDGLGPPDVARNTNCWAYGLDLTGVPYHGPWASVSNGTAVSPRHLLTTQHVLWVIPDGSAIVFWDSTDTLVTRHVLAASDRDVNHGAAVILLDEDLPSTVKKYPLLPDDWHDYISLLAYYAPSLHVSHGVQFGTQTPQASMRRVGSFPPNEWQMPMYEGDSGSPFFMMVGADLVLFSIISGSSLASPSAHIARLQADMDRLSDENDVDRYTLQRYDLSGYEIAASVPYSCLIGAE